MVVSFRPDAAGGIKDPAVNPFLQPLLHKGIELLAAAQAVEIAVRVEAQLRRGAATAGHVAARIAEGLEVTDGVWVLKGRHRCYGRLEDQSVKRPSDGGMFLCYKTQPYPQFNQARAATKSFLRIAYRTCTSLVWSPTLAQPSTLR